MRLVPGVLKDAGPTTAAGVKCTAGKAAADKALNAQEKEDALPPPSPFHSPSTVS